MEEFKTLLVKRKGGTETTITVKCGGFHNLHNYLLLSPNTDNEEDVQIIRFL